MATIDINERISIRRVEGEAQRGANDREVVIMRRRKGELGEKAGEDGTAVVAASSTVNTLY